ncbi:SNF2-related protein [Enterococcus diestrammenae]|uniref:SNF2-related protein n=1 Tax=Enterococcus diestrammenae TaxID=1155073 RepID=UPI0022E1CDA1|nr:SNF2-related protein [Enterococcus diestrammenae]
MTYTEKVKEKIQPQYTSNLVESFYQPLLSEANLYQRVSGYFSTAGLDLYAEGLEELAKNGGKVEFIISKEISADDYRRIQDGYNLLNEIKPLTLAERNDKLNTKTQQQLGNLAFMIALGRARVKVALTDKGIFHDKFGLIHSDDECVLFSGSANETQSGISRNYESISVDVSWDKSENVISRLKSYKERFARLWDDCEPGVKVIEASDLAYEEIAKYQPQARIEYSDIQDDEPILQENSITFLLKGNTIFRYDTTLINLTNTDRKLKRGSDLTQFFEEDNQTVKSTTTYKNIERIISVTEQRANRKNIKVLISDAVKEFISRNKYSIEQYKILGEVYKGRLDKFPHDKLVSFEEFSGVVQNEVQRPLYNLHLRAAYYEYEMARAANFSVPGAGKTAMLLGVFAFLNRAEVSDSERIDRILVISPINAFDSWKREFKEVFGEKKQLRPIDCQSSNDFKYQLNTDWGVSNLVLINYESLPSYVDQLKQVIDDKTMLVFDEVHRIKNPYGKRAAKALEIARIPKFKYVLTGTPIPNTYQDIYNFLHILYGNEYSSYFGWDSQSLLNPKYRMIREINQKIHPFFWRTNKTDLLVPPAEDDHVELVAPTAEQLDLAEEIYFNEPSSFAKLIRLLQASTNPSLVKESINYNELMSYDDDGDIKGISEKEFNELLGSAQPTKDGAYSTVNFDTMVSSKFVRGIELVSSIANQNKKILVWGIFVDTLKKITNELRTRGYKVNLVYGGTDKSERVQLIDEFRDGDVQILVSNPQTLGESISLHQTVHDAVYFEFDFNLTFMLQSRDRIHRLGLNSNQYTRYYYLQTTAEDVFSNRPGFIDEKVYKRLKEKEQVMYGAIDDNTLSIEYSENEIRDAIKIIDEERERINRSK